MNKFLAYVLAQIVTFAIFLSSYIPGSMFIVVKYSFSNENNPEELH